MGQGEYGGNGSVHYRATFRRDRNNGRGSPHTYTEVDDFPAQADGGDFTITVFGLETGRAYYVDANGRLTVEVAIAHHPRNYTRQVLIEWPDP
jgi:hypothetical protein